LLLRYECPWWLLRDLTPHVHHHAGDPEMCACRWEIEASKLLAACGMDVLTFENFLHCTVAFPPIAIGICLLRHADIKPQPATADVEPGSLALKMRQQKGSDELEQHLSQVLISINPSGSDMASQNEAANSSISETFLGQNVAMESATFIVTVVGATYGMGSSCVCVRSSSPSSAVHSSHNSLLSSFHRFGHF
jgi:hypothetical protein